MELVQPLVETCLGNGLTQPRACVAGGDQVELLLEREWSSEAFGQSLVEASKSLQPNLVTALLRRRRSVRPTSFQSALHSAIAQGHMPTLMALVSNVTSLEETRDACLSTAINTAFNHGNVSHAPSLVT